MKTRIFLALLALMASSAAAQQRQPANVSTLPTTSPQEFDLLDNQGRWMPFGTASGGVFTPSGGTGTDVRQFGCVDDGVTDQAACINNAIAQAPGCVIIPPTVSGFYVAAGSTINLGKCLKGSFYNPDWSFNVTYPAAFAGQPWIKCATSATSICVKSTYDGAYLENLTIATSYPPAVGSIGLQIAGGYNSQLRNVNVSGFDQCAYWLSGIPAGNGIASHAIGLNLNWCQTYYAVQDGWAELYLTDGRWGPAGPTPSGATANSPKAALYITKSQNQGAGGGPNTLVMTNVQVNGGYAECMVKWGGWTGTGGGQSEYKFIGNHWEFLAPAPTSPTKKGIFCTDSTVPVVRQLYAVASEFQFDQAGGGDTFAFDPATAVQNMSLTNSFFGGDSTTLVFGSGGAAAYASQWTNNYFGGNMHLTGDPSTRLSMSNNIANVATIDGTWGRLSASGNVANGWVDGTARGSIAVSNSIPNSWTPVVKFGGTASTLAYVTAGQAQRTPTGGFMATFNINAAAGTEGSHGLVTITGLPYKCLNFLSPSPPYSQNNFPSTTGIITLRYDGADPVNINLLKPLGTGTGFNNMSDTDFTATTNFSGTLVCGTAG